MTHTYLVHMPQAEARHLAGTGYGWPAAPQARLAAALREWLAGISRRHSAVIPVRKVVADLTLILEVVPMPQWPLHGPFGPGRAGAERPAFTMGDPPAQRSLGHREGVRGDGEDDFARKSGARWVLCICDPSTASAAPARACGPAREDHQRRVAAALGSVRRGARAWVTSVLTRSG